MKKVNVIISNIVDNVISKVSEAIDFGENKVETVMSFGDADVYVTIGYDIDGGWLCPVKTVTIEHAANNKSPRLEQAICDAIPSWEEIEKHYI